MCACSRVFVEKLVAEAISPAPAAPSSGNLLTSGVHNVHQYRAPRCTRVRCTSSLYVLSKACWHIFPDVSFITAPQTNGFRFKWRRATCLSKVACFRKASEHGGKSLHLNLSFSSCAVRCRRRRVPVANAFKHSGQLQT